MEKTRKATLDLTRGPTLPLMLRFCLPILLGNLMQQFYNMVDAAVVGQVVGTNALAAVGATGPITFLVLGFVEGISVGFCIPVAQEFGAENDTGLRRCVMNILWLGVFFSAFLTVITSLLLGRMLYALDFTADIYGDAFSYLRVIFLGIPATMAYNCLSGIMRSMGNSRTPLLILVFSSILNVLLDLLFVKVLSFGVTGAAVATILAQILSALACLVYIVRTYAVLHAEREDRRFRPRVAWRLFSSGVPMALQYSITAIGSVLIQAAVNRLGTDIVASVTAANKVQNFVHLPFGTLGVTLSTWCGQNLGAGRYDRIKNGFRCGMWMALLYSVAMSAFMFFCGSFLSLIFIDSSEPRLPELLMYIRMFLRHNSLFYIPLAVLTVCRFSLQGLGHAFTAMFAGLFEMIARTIVALVFATRYGFDAICFANPMAWIAACVLLVPACLVVFPRVRRQLEARPASSEKGEIQHG